ncbi:hypothetical protein VCHC70A1_0412 [Vibrio cholerae HC-70A1]|nr:hypothetical protein VIG_000097 [Vibrio cholerae INDRE 91/1]EGR05134.1 hypothetical protein VCHCUF01_0442 [Vibrio cholerae HCUF01]EGR06216.1 hypothetical protein VCHC49A2_0426 [Vibrio cholerae HC-49A2]EGS51288.1 hypothetical protein VCHC70A1_0412 [Vibrio cholerae HC-70A1]EGS65958.1 hypothetical protein VCHFU02_0409 [Vibrio cholerae HFU-02]EHH75233.1 hypothetical protein VCHC06A1_0410 [Vibrio cholerae HC-06A1]EHH88057.1 hypothetical protein VCHC22A1_0400 [Vibrio cholerae HC-22A1]EHH96381.1
MQFSRQLYKEANHLINIEKNKPSDVISLGLSKNSKHFR